MKKYRDYSDADVEIAVKNNNSLSGVLKDLNLRVAGGNFDNIKRKIAQLGLDTSHFTGQLWNKGKTVKDWAEYKQNTGRKKLLVDERGYKCESCSLTKWLEKPIVLEVHHKDGNRLNNTKENLQLLCCNCHAATDNWKNKKRV